MKKPVQPAPFQPRRRAAIEEKDLIAHILSGEKDLYRELVEKNQVDLYRLCLAVLSNTHEAEDAAQTAFIKAYRSLGSFRMGSSFKTWITRIAINHCKDIIRKKRTRQFFSLNSMLETLKSLPETLISRQPEEPAEVPAIPRGAWETLSEAERAVLGLLKDKPDISYEEIARQLGLSLDSVKGKLKRARIKLRAYRDRLNPGTERE
jgi:RNA polymerase sigma-70 factor, ECF subfamily